MKPDIPVPLDEKNLHAGRRARVKKRYLDSGGLDEFADHEVLELLLYYTHPRGDTNLLAHRYIEAYGGLANLLEADPLAMIKRLGISSNVAIMISLIPHLSKRYLKSRWQAKPVLDTTAKLGAYAQTLFVGERYESLYLICLDRQYQLLGAHQLSQGTIDSVPIYPRHVVEAALRYNAFAVVLAHNHPSGELRAGTADLKATKQIKHALSVIDIQVMDHIIVGGEGYYSFHQHDLMRQI